MVTGLRITVLEADGAMSGNDDDPIARFNLEMPQTAQVALVGRLISVGQSVAADCESRLSLFPLPSPRGQDRYYAFQDAFLGMKGEHPIFDYCRLEPHKGGSTKFAVLDSPRLRLVLIKAASPGAAIPLRRLAAAAHPQQLELFREEAELGERLVAVLVYGYGDDPTTPSFMVTRFVDEHQRLRREEVDMLAVLASPVDVPVEDVADMPQTPLRRRRSRKPDAGA